MTIIYIRAIPVRNTRTIRESFSEVKVLVLSRNMSGLNIKYMGFFSHFQLGDIIIIGQHIFNGFPLNAFSAATAYSILHVCLSHIPQKAFK